MKSEAQQERLTPTRSPGGEFTKGLQTGVHRLHQVRQHLARSPRGMHRGSPAPPPQPALRGPPPLGRWESLSCFMEHLAARGLQVSCLAGQAK